MLKDIKIPFDWGLEIGVLSEMYRNYASNRLCRVDITDSYDHKHQDISIEDSSRGLSKMSVDIIKAIIRKLASQGRNIFDVNIRSQSDILQRGFRLRSNNKKRCAYEYV